MQGAPGVPRATGSLTALSPALSVTCSIADVSDTCCTPRDPPCPARDGWNPRLAAMQQLSHRGVEAELGRYGIGTQRSAVTRRSKCHAQCAPESALLPRSGRRWREAPDEGASAASLDRQSTRLNSSH